MDGVLPDRHDLATIFDELDYQLAAQAYFWALILVSYAQWSAQHRDVFGATDYDLVSCETYRDRLGLITANATTPYIINFIGAPAGHEDNWVQTIPGKHWFSYFRLYGPLEPYLQRTWALNDVVPA